MCDPLVATLDGRNDNAIHKEETTQGIQKRNSLATVDASNYTHMIARRQSAKLLKNGKYSCEERACNRVYGKHCS